jgi:hypothetical protein
LYDDLKGREMQRFFNASRVAKGEEVRLPFHICRLTTNRIT